MTTAPDPDEVRTAILALVVAVEHDPATVDSITIKPGEVVVTTSHIERNGLITGVWTYPWNTPLID